MCFSSAKTPTPPPPVAAPPPPPTPVSPEVTAAKQRSRSQRSGRAYSILTSPQGLLTEANTTNKKSLLGL